jgi:hypothetical protein
VTIAMFRALHALAGEPPQPEHICGERVDGCDEECCIAAAVIPAEGVE